MATSKKGPLKMLAAGTVLGAALVFAAAAGMQYSDTRPFCSTCHVMHEAALTHSQSPHAELACNECHAPHNLLAKIPFKAKEGNAFAEYLFRSAVLFRGQARTL